MQYGSLQVSVYNRQFAAKQKILSQFFVYNCCNQWVRVGVKAVSFCSRKRLKWYILKCLLVCVLCPTMYQNNVAYLQNHLRDRLFAFEPTLKRCSIKPSSFRKSFLAPGRFLFQTSTLVTLFDIPSPGGDCTGKPFFFSRVLVPKITRTINSISLMLLLKVHF